AEDGIRDKLVTGVQTCALPIYLFQPSFKLREKTRVGSRVIKRYHAPETPCARLLMSNDISEQVKSKLTDIAESLDPLQLLDEIRSEERRVGKSVELGGSCQMYK